VPHVTTDFSARAASVAQATIPGFRKGKAPANIVLNHFGKKSVSAEACEEIISASVPMALQQKDIRVSCGGNPDCHTSETQDQFDTPPPDCSMLES
jgi:FKBP-type peptidyl-prolyl cis-trans isomerase (trigger factor)